MNKLIAVSPIGKNGQTVVPASIRRMFKFTEKGNLVGFYLNGSHVEIAPVSVVKEDIKYTKSELDKLDRLSNEKGGKKFKTTHEAKNYLNSL